MSSKWFTGVALAALIAAGCGSNSPTSPGLSVQSLQGAWASSSNNTAPNACTNFKWTVTSISGNGASGTFTATCLGSFDVAGTASGTLAGSTLTWTASGTGTPAGGASCAFSLAGTATLESNNQVRIPYSGTTCFGPVSGVEVLKK